MVPWPCWKGGDLHPGTCTLLRKARVPSQSLVNSVTLSFQESERAHRAGCVRCSNHHGDPVLGVHGPRQERGKAEGGPGLGTSAQDPTDRSPRGQKGRRGKAHCGSNWQSEVVAQRPPRCHLQRENGA